MNTLQKYVNENKYELLSKFKTVKEFNNHFEQAMLLHKDKFTKSEYIGLNKLRKFAYSENSSNTIGVAWCKIQKAVAATHKDAMFGISRATFIRMINKAKKLNLITVYNQYRKNKYKKHNVYVFNRLEELTPENFEVVEIVSKTDTIKTSESVKIDESITLILQLPKLKDYKTYSQANGGQDEETNVIDFEESKTEYQQLKEMVDGLFKEKNIMYKIYGAWLTQVNKGIVKLPFALAKRALKILIGEVKERIAGDIEPLYNPAGYYRGILLNLIEQWDMGDAGRYEDDLEENIQADNSTFDSTNSDALNRFKDVFYNGLEPSYAY